MEEMRQHRPNTKLIGAKIRHTSQFTFCGSGSRTNEEADSRNQKIQNLSNLNRRHAFTFLPFYSKPE